MATKTSAAVVLAGMILVSAGQAQATLMLDASVTGQFNGATSTTDTFGNDLTLPRPTTLYFGQLKALADGYVDLFYVGNEAGYTNTFIWGDGQSFSTASQPDVFTSPDQLIGTLAVVANTFLNFAFCTSGGDSVNGAGRCAANDSSTSLVDQFNYQANLGYRTIGYSSLSAYDPNIGERAFNGIPGTSTLWMAFWDDSGASIDDDYDDMIVGMRFRPLVAVPEPGTMGLLTLGLLGAALARRRQLRRAGLR